MPKSVPLPPLDERQRYTVDEAAAYLRVSRARLYQHIDAGRISTVCDGRRRYVPGSAIAAMSQTSSPSGGASHEAA